MRFFSEFSGWFVILLIGYACASLLVAGVIEAVTSDSFVPLVWGGVPAIAAIAAVLAIRKTTAGGQ